MRVLCALQGGYYFLSGLWPVLHMPSFERVTGDKSDEWLVVTIGLLVAATGVALLRESRQRSIANSLALVAALQAFALFSVDIVYVWAGRISSIYLGDAAVEGVFVASWMWLYRDRTQPGWG